MSINSFRLVEVNEHDPMHFAVLYALLQERTPDQAISHKTMPSWGQHVEFVRSKPYKGWYLIAFKGVYVGSTYFSKQNEIGIFIFKESIGRGFAVEAIKHLKELHEGPYYANINPKNEASIKFFEKLGFKFLQVTYVQE